MGEKFADKLTCYIALIILDHPVGPSSCRNYAISLWLSTQREKTLLLIHVGYFENFKILGLRRFRTNGSGKIVFNAFFGT